MPRYIDADALMEASGLNDAVKWGNKGAEQRHKSYSTMMLYEIADMIDDAPTADVAPVVHGKWNTIKRHRHWPDGSEYEKDYCSVCRHCGSAEYAYCPYCGARMDEKEESGE